MRPLNTTQQYYTYILHNPFTAKPFYVGKGKGNRMYAHAKEVMHKRIPNGNNGYLYREIKSILQNSGSINYEVANDRMTEEEAFALEAAYVDEIGLDNLCNIAKPSLGWGLSRGKCGYFATKETRAKLKASHTTPERIKNSKTNRAKQLGFNTLEAFEQHKRKQHLLKTDIPLLHNIIGEIRKQRLKEWEDLFKRLKRKGWLQKQHLLKTDIPLLHNIIGKIRKQRLKEWKDLFKPLKRIGWLQQKGYNEYDIAKSRYSKLCLRCNKVMSYSRPCDLSRSVNFNYTCCKSIKPPQPISIAQTTPIIASATKFRAPPKILPAPYQCLFSNSRCKRKKSNYVRKKRLTAH